MLNRPIFRFISLALILALLSGPTGHNADAQTPQRPQEPKQTQPQADAVDGKDGRRQGPQADERAADKNGLFNLGMDPVSLDVMVIDQNNLAVAGLKKEDFTVYEDKVKQTVENVIREE